MADILVTEKIIGPAMTALRDSCDVAFEPDLWQAADRLQELIPKVKALIVRNQTQVTAELIRRGARLKIIARAAPASIISTFRPRPTRESSSATHPCRTPFPWRSSPSD